jgi:hypothetical protein
MPSASQKMQIPVDANSNPLNRSMGIPLTVVRKLTSSTQWCDVFDLSDYGPRVFIGLMAQNPSATLKVQLSFDEEPVGDEEAAITVLSQGTIAVDNLTFGPGVNDFTYGTRVMRLRGRLLGGSTGTLSSATITYSGTNVTDGMQVQINGTTYEFSADLSAAGGVIAVALGANADGRDRWGRGCCGRRRGWRGNGRYVLRQHHWRRWWRGTDDQHLVRGRRCLQ